MTLSTNLVRIGLVFLAFPLALAEVAANPMQATHPPQDLSTQLRYPVTPMRFEGIINGIPINASGTVQELYAQAANDPLFASRQNTADTELVAREKVRRAPCI